MLHGTYVGPAVALKGKTASLQHDPVEPGILAKFDDVSDLGLGWDEWFNYNESDFKRDALKVTDLLGQKLVRVDEPGDAGVGEDQVRFVFEDGVLMVSAVPDGWHAGASIYLEVTDE